MHVVKRRRSRWAAWTLAAAGSVVAAATMAGCASPGAPRPPSLQLPRVARDLSAERSGGQVLLRFRVPTETTDNVPLRGTAVRGQVCRQDVPHAACIKLDLADAAAALPLPNKGQPAPLVTWVDVLPAELATGTPRVLAYRLEWVNDNGKTAGFSQPAFVAAGAAPEEVRNLRAEGTRVGVLLKWSSTPGAGEVLLKRQQLQSNGTFAPSKRSNAEHNDVKGIRPRSLPAAKDVVWLQASPGRPDATETVDGDVVEGVLYRYSAIRRVVVQIGGRTLELQSAPSTPVQFIWRDVFPPSAPQNLTGVGFHLPAADAQGGEDYAVDLIWQPASDVRVTGYVVRRTAVSEEGTALGRPERLDAVPITTTSFRDLTAQSGQNYKYEVTAVDAKGNTSGPSEVLVRSSPR